MRPSTRVTAVTAVTASLLLSGCSKEALGGTAGKDIKVLPASTLPTTLNGLAVKPERVTKALSEAKHSYINAVGFFSLRENKVVQGTIQVSAFGPEARLADEGFRTQLVTQSSPGSPTPVNVGGATVQQSTGTKSTVSIWFSRERMVVLNVLSGYTGSRGLLEQSLLALPVT